MKNLHDLLSRYIHFSKQSHVDGDYKHQDLAQGQSPRIMIIGCCDSRVSPTTLFDAEFGELFIARNVANLVPPHEQAHDYAETFTAIEFAVETLGIENIIIMGHKKCGGVKACLDHYKSACDADQDANTNTNDTPTPAQKYLSLLETPAREVLDNAPDTADLTELYPQLERSGIRQSLAHLKTYPFIMDKVKSGDLHLYGVYFDIEDGTLYVLNNYTDQFEDPRETADLSNLATPA